MQTSRPASILVIDNVDGSRHALLSTLREGGHDAIGFASLDAVPQGDRPVPMCVIARLGLVASVMTEQVARLRLEFSAPVLAIIERGDVRAAVAAVKAGAFDVVEIPFAAADVLMTVERALGEEAPAELEVARGRLARLTSRERDVLRGLMAGKINKTIGQELGISPRTVEVYRSHIMTKTRVDSLPDLLRLASQAEAGEEGQAVV